MPLGLVVGHRKELQVGEFAVERPQLRLGLVTQAIGKLLRFTHIVAIQLFPERQ